jgi:AcrR family transcriptional regulator
MPRTGLTADQIRDRAVAFAADRMRKDGFDRVRLVDVARELGVSHVALYKHFPDKAALLDAVSARWLGDVDRGLEAIGADAARPPLEGIRDVFLTLHRAKRERVRSDPELYRAFDAASEAAKPFIVAHMTVVRTVLGTLVREAAAVGALPAGDPARAAQLLIEAMVAFTHPKLVVLALEVDREPDLRRMLDVVVAGLRASG